MKEHTVASRSITLMVLSLTGLIQYKGFSHCNFNCKNSLLQGSVEVIICVYWLKVPVLKSLLA